MEINVDADNLYKGTVDKQGRKFLTRELGGKTVTVAVVEVHEDE